MQILEPDDSLLRQRVGNRDPFLVPEGYFEGLTKDIMSCLPEKKQKTRPLWVRYAVAASVAAVVAIGAVVAIKAPWSVAPETDFFASADVLDDDYVDDYLDYAMVCNDDIAYYLTEAY